MRRGRLPLEARLKAVERSWLSMELFAPALMNGLLMGFMYALIAAGLSLIYGVMGLINFSHGALVMLAMYVTYWLHELLHLDPLISIVPVAALFFFVGMGLYRSTVRRMLDSPFLMQAVISFGIATFMVNLSLVLWKADFRTIPVSDRRLEVFGTFMGMRQIAGALACLGAFTALSYIVYCTSIGRKIRAVSEDRHAALLMGIDTDAIFSFGWGIGVAAVGVAGAMAAMLYPIFPDVGTRFALYCFAAVTLGGFGSLPGAFVGGLLLGLVESLSGVYIFPALKSAAAYLMFVIVLLVRPQGLFGLK